MSTILIVGPVAARKNVQIPIFVPVHKLWSRTCTSPDAWNNGPFVTRLDPIGSGELVVTTPAGTIRHLVGLATNDGELVVTWPAGCP